MNLLILKKDILLANDFAQFCFLRVLDILDILRASRFTFYLLLASFVFGFVSFILKHKLSIDCVVSLRRSCF